MKTVRALLNTNANHKQMGNHSMAKTVVGRDFTYHWTVICSVNDIERTFTTNNGGWNTSSTTRAINAYKYELTARGYREV